MKCLFGSSPLTCTTLWKFLHFQIATNTYKLEMEALYHQTNGLLEQTQGYFIRLEQGGGGESEKILLTEQKIVESSRKDLLKSNLRFAIDLPNMRAFFDILPSKNLPKIYSAYQTLTQSIPKKIFNIPEIYAK